jgi:NAD(P)H dehydrogenase (quinone)
MHVVVVFAHPNRRSFCGALLDEFASGLREAGHTSDLIDLCAIRFDPVFGRRDYPSYLDLNSPADLLEAMDLRKAIVRSVPAPLRPFARRYVRDKDIHAVARLIRARMPRDVRNHQARLDSAQGLAFVSPVYWIGLPAILKGWFERVFTPGFAYTLTPEAWRTGALDGRVPLLRQEKALVMNTTFFPEADYERAQLGEPMRRTVDEFGLSFPGVKHVQHEYFFAVGSVQPEVRRGYLARAHELGLRFAEA